MCLDCFYENYGGGCSLGTSISKYVYVAFRPREDSVVEIHSYYGDFVYDSWLDIEDPLIRNCFRFAQGGMDLWISSDVIPGSGLGTSSAMIVGILTAVHDVLDMRLTDSELAQYAARLEMNCVPVGKQDAYFSVYGGVNRFHFGVDDTVEREEIAYDGFSDLDRNLLLFDTGVVRKTSKILSDPADPQILRLIRLIAKNYKFGEVDFGDALKDTWRLKRSYSGSITNDEFDVVYDRALDKGALGGKMLGAGGGGHFLFYVPFEKKTQFVGEMSRVGLRHVPFRLDYKGSHIV